MNYRQRAMMLYRSARWRRMRTEHLRVHRYCKFCLETGRHAPATIVDHKRPHRCNEALFFDRTNLQSLCKPCHDGTKQQAERSGGLRGCDVHGNPLDPQHPWALETKAATPCADFSNRVGERTGASLERFRLEKASHG